MASIISESAFIAIEGDASDAEGAIKLSASALHDSGYVSAGFAQACIERELQFPTGICSEIPVALPHCTSNEILKNGICYLRLSEPVIFRRMDDDQEEIETRHIFNLAFDRGDHLGMLSRVMNLIQDPIALSALDSMPLKQIAPFLKDRLERIA